MWRANTSDEAATYAVRTPLWRVLWREPQGFLTQDVIVTGGPTVSMGGYRSSPKTAGNTVNLRTKPHTGTGGADLLVVKPVKS